MRKIPIQTDKAPEAIGPYSQAILYTFGNGYLMELSGQIGINPKSGELVDGLEAQTSQALDNIEGVLSAAGWGFENVTKARIYLVNMENYGEVNKIYAERFTNNPPSRAAVGVKELPIGALVEIECSAGGRVVHMVVPTKRQT